MIFIYNKNSLSNLSCFFKFPQIIVKELNILNVLFILEFLKHSWFLQIHILLLQIPEAVRCEAPRRVGGPAHSQRRWQSR